MIIRLNLKKLTKLNSSLFFLGIIGYIASIISAFWVYSLVSDDLPNDVNNCLMLLVFGFTGLAVWFMHHAACAFWNLVSIANKDDGDSQ